MSENNNNNNSDSNSKKRKDREEINNIIENNNEKIPKKQKINNDDESISSRSNEINYTNKTNAQLHSMAKSLQLSARTRLNRNELIDRIKSVLARKVCITKQLEIRNKLNSFSKGYIELEIKEGLGPCERAFWKVFRNRIMFSNIMSNMNKSFSVDYDSIISVTKMIKHNQLSILRDKVLRNQYLVFHYLGKRQYNYGDNPDCDKLQHNDMYQVFKSFREDTPQDYLFYQRLFQHYQPFIFNFNHIKVGNEIIIYDIVKGRELLVNQIIESKCLVAFNVLVNHYNYKPTEFNFQHAVNIGSVKFLYPIISEINKQEATVATTAETSTSTSVTVSTDPQSTIQSIPTSIPLEFNNQIIEILLKYKSNCSPISFRSLWYLMEKKIINLNENASKGDDDNNVVLQYVRNIEIHENITIKTLVAISSVILSIIGGTELQFSFTKEVKRLELKHSLIQHSEIKERIIDLLNVFYEYCNIEIPASIQYYFGNNEEAFYDQQYQIKSSIPNVIYHLKVSFQFADIKLFRKCIESINAMSNETSEICSELIKVVAFSFVKGSGECNGDFLFSHCDQLEKQISFIDFIASVTGIIGDNNGDGGDYGVGNNQSTQDQETMKQLKLILKPELILFLLVGYNNLQLIGYFGELLGELQLDYNIEGLPFTVNHFIQSNEMLEYIFTYHNGFLNFKCNYSSKIWYFKSGQLLQHYIRLFKNANGENSLILVPGFAVSILNRSSTDTIISIVNAGRDSFVFKSIFDLYKAVNLCCPSVELRIILFKLIFINYYYNGVDAITFTGNNNQPFYTREAKKLNSYPFLKFLDWMYLNHYNYLNPNLVGVYSVVFQENNSHNGIAKSVLSKIGRYDGINLFNGYFEIDEFNLDWEDLNLIDYILNDLKSQSNIYYFHKELLYKILEYSARSGRLKVFEFIFQYHNWVLKQPAVGVPLFRVQKLFELLFTSLIFNHIHLSKFFFEILPKVSVKTFNKNSSDLSKIHFSNFQFKSTQNNKKKKKNQKCK